MFSTTRKSSNERFRFNQYNPISQTEYKNISEDSPYLIEQIYLDRNIYNNNIPNYPFNPSFNFQYDYIPKTQENSYYNYCDHKSMPYLQQYRDNDNNIMLNDIKEKEKQIRILNQNYEENWKEEMKKDIKTYKYGVNLNISNYETQEAINLSSDKEYNLIKRKNGHRFNKKRMKISKSFSNFDPNALDKTKIKNSKTPKKINNNRENLSCDSHNINNPIHKYSKTCTNFFANKNNNNKDKDDLIHNEQINDCNKCKISNNEDPSFEWKIKLFIEKLEEYFVQSLTVFFCFFIHRLKLYIKLSEIRNIKYISQLSDELQINKNNSYKYNNFRNGIYNSDKKNEILVNKTFQKKNKDAIHITNLKKANLKNSSFNIKLNNNCQKHVQFDKNSIKNMNIKNAKNEYSCSSLNGKSNKKSYPNSSTAFNSNEIKSTNSCSNFGKNQNISNNSLLKNKKNIHIFNKENENSLPNMAVKNTNLSYDKKNTDNKYIKYKNTIQCLNEIYKNKNTLIYVKPKIEDLKMFKIDKVSNFPNNKIYSDNKIELSIKSMILKKKKFSKSFKSSNGQKKIESNQNYEFKEIIIKDIRSNDKRINISIKYIISEKYLKGFTKAKIRKRLISLKNIKNIFINNDIELLKPMKVESFDYIPVITIVKVNIEDNDYDNKNKETNKKLCDIIDIINSLYKKYIIYFGKYFLNELENSNNHIKLISNGNLSEKENEFNNINISCISNKINKNQENEIIIEENYSLNKDIDNILINNNEKIETEKYISDMDHINKMISPENSGNENFLVNENYRINNRENIKLSVVDINQPKKNKKFDYNNNYQLNQNIIKNDKDDETKQLNGLDCDSIKKNKLFAIKISRHKICKNILKDIKIKREKIDKDRILKMKNLFFILENKLNRMNIHYLELIKYNFDRWKQIISKTNIENYGFEDKPIERVKIINNEIDNKNNEIISISDKNRNKSINESEIMKDKKSINKYSSNFEMKIDKNDFTERIKEFRLYLIDYFAFRLKNILYSDD